MIQQWFIIIIIIIIIVVIIIIIIIIIIMNILFEIGKIYIALQKPDTWQLFALEIS